MIVGVAKYLGKMLLGRGQSRIVSESWEETKFVNADGGSERVWPAGEASITKTPTWEGSAKGQRAIPSADKC